MAKHDEWITKDGLLRLESWASDGLTNTQIAKNIGVSRQTLDNWCKKHVDIFHAIKKGREPVVREIENAIVKSAKGYEYEETSTEVWLDDEGNRRQKVVKHKRYAKPDTSAAIFLLKNYKPEKYRNYNELTRRQIEAEIRKLEAEAKRAEKEAEELEVNHTEELLTDYFEKLGQVIDDDVT